MTIARGKREARARFETMLAWRPRNVILANGRCYFGDALPICAARFAGSID